MTHRNGKLEAMLLHTIAPSKARKIPVAIESHGGVALSVLYSQRKENKFFSGRRSKDKKKLFRGNPSCGRLK